MIIFGSKFIRQLKRDFWLALHRHRIKKANKIRKQIEQLEIDKEINK